MNRQPEHGLPASAHSLRFLVGKAMAALGLFVVGGLAGAFVSLLAADCWPSQTEALGPTWARSLVIGSVAAAPALLSRTGPALLRRGSGALGAAGFLSLAASVIETARPRFGVCERVGHYAPGHVHHAHPAGDMGILLVFAGAAGALILLAMAIGGLAAGWFWKARRRRNAAPGPLDVHARRKTGLP